MPAAAGAWVAGTALGLTSGTAAFAIASGLTQLLVGTALSSLARALGPTPQASGGGIRTTVTLEGGTLPQTLILGRTATKGSLVAPFYAYGEVSVDDQSVENAYRWRVVDIADHPVTGLPRFWIDGTSFLVGTDTEGSLTTGLGVEASSLTRPRWDRNGRHRMKLRFWDGTQTVADPNLVSRFGGRAGTRAWGADRIGRGIAYTVTSHRWDPNLYRGEPEVLLEVLGSRLYDRRKDSTAGGSGTHRRQDPATWEYTENPVTMVAAILLGIPLTDGTVWGLGVDPADMPTAAWFAAANHCDELVDGQPRYRAGYEVRMATPDAGGDEPFAVIDELLKACAGAVADCGGTWTVRAGAPGLPVAFLTDDDVVVSRPQEFEPHRGLREVWNAVRATYPNPDNAWATKEAPLRKDDAAIAEDGEMLVADLALPAVPYPDQVQRLGQALLRDARRMRRYTLTLPPEFGNVLPLDTISWTSARNGWTAKVFEVAEVALDPRTAAATLSVREVDPADYAWSRAADLLPSDTSGTSSERPALAPFPLTAATGVSLEDGTGAARRPGIEVTFAPDLAGVNTLTWEVRVQATGSYVTAGSTADLSRGAVRLPGDFVGGTTYEVRVKGDTTDWSGWTAVTTPSLGLKPADLDQPSFQTNGLALFGGELRSSNFVAGSTGWRITSAGDAEFRDLITRGDLAPGAVSDEWTIEYAGPFVKPSGAFVGHNVALLTMGEALPPGNIYLRAISFEGRRTAGTTVLNYAMNTRERNGGVWGPYVTRTSYVLADFPSNGAWVRFTGSNTFGTSAEDYEMTFDVASDAAAGSLMVRNVTMVITRATTK